MPVPTDLYRIQYTFDLGLDGEVAVTGFHARYALGGSETVADVAQALADWGLAAWLAVWNTSDLHARFPTSVVLRDVRAYHVVDSGPSDGLGLSTADGSDAWAGTGPDSLPWEVALVATLEAIPAGTRPAKPRRQRGRMYLPPISVGSIGGPAGFITDAELPGFNDTVLALLEHFNDIPPTLTNQARVVVFSRTGNVAHDVLRVSMDNQCDLQKRRQNRQTGMVRTFSADLAP
jgi:hypothetical protein